MNQFLLLASQAGGYGIGITLALATVVSNNPSFEQLATSAVVAMGAAQTAYFLRLLPWSESIRLRPLQANITSVDGNLQVTDPELLKKLERLESADPFMQRIIETTKKIMMNDDFNGFPSADLAALVAGFGSFQFQKQSPFFALFAFVMTLSCAYGRVDFVPFHTWPQVLGGIAAGVVYAFLSEQFGALALGAAVISGTVFAYLAFAQKTPRPVFLNIVSFLFPAYVLCLIASSEQF